MTIATMAMAPAIAMKKPMRSGKRRWRRSQGKAAASDSVVGSEPRSLYENGGAKR